MAKHKEKKIAHLEHHTSNNSNKKTSQIANHKSLSIINLFRPINLLFVLITQYFVRHFIILPLYFPPVNEHVYLSIANSSLTHLQFFLLVLSTVCITAAGYVINDILDQEVDRHNKPHKQYIGDRVGQLSEKTAMRLYGLLNIVGIALSIYLAYTVGNYRLPLIHIICVVLLYLYSASWKKKPLVGNLLVASLAALVVILVGLYEEKLTNYWLTKWYLGATGEDVIARMIWMLMGAYALFAFLLTMIREIVKDVQDYEGDLKGSYQTLPIRFGIPIANALTSVIVILTIYFVLRFQLWRLNFGEYGIILVAFSCLQLPLIYILWQLWKYKEKANYGQLSSLLKILMLIGLLYLPYLGMSISANPPTQDNELLEEIDPPKK